MKILKDFPRLSQGNYDSLCWAACTGMIVNWMRRTSKSKMTLSDIVFEVNRTEFFNRIYDSTRDYGFLKGILKSFDISCEFKKGNFCKEYVGIVKSSIDSELPVMAGIRKNQTTYDGHLVMIIGYTSDSLIIIDPFMKKGIGMVAYDYFCDGYGNKKWNLIWYNFRR